MISKAKLENYFTILAVMENNMAEYLELVEQLKSIQAEVKELNNAMKERELEAPGFFNKEKEEEYDFGMQGDALTRLLLRNRSVFKTKAF
jgi:hypothetical protein